MFAGVGKRDSRRLAIEQFRPERGLQCPQGVARRGRRHAQLRPRACNPVRRDKRKKKLELAERGHTRAKWSAH